MRSPIALNAEAGLISALHDHWRLFLGEGVGLVLLGLIAVLAPFVAGLAATVLFGWVLLMTGAVGLFATARARGAPGFAWSLLSALLALAAGAVLLWRPLTGLVTLTYVLVAFFIVDGAFTVVLALTHRRARSARWTWMLVNGLLDLVLAWAILAGLPGTLLWAFGVLIGVDLLFGGVSLAAMALGAREATPEPQPEASPWKG